MKKHVLPFSLSCLLGLVVGAVASFVVLRAKIEAAIEDQKELTRRLDEMKETMEAANTHVLLLEAQLDLSEKRLGRLLEDEGNWRELN